MKSGFSLRRSAATVVFVAGAALPLATMAQGAPAAATAWRYSASLYLYLPTLGGQTSFPADGAGTGIEVDGSLLDHLKMTFFGAFDAHNGRWGVFSDVAYVDLGAAKTQTRDFTIGHLPLPASTTADLDYDLKMVAWTLAGQYRVPTYPALTLDLLGGTRLLDVRQRLRWSISGSLGSLAAGSRSGEGEVDATLWDAIVGVKGRWALDADRKWSLPFHLDIGGGQSKSTWQAAAGISYAFQGVEATVMWRYLDYRLKPGLNVESVNLNGPLIGATFRW